MVYYDWQEEVKEELSSDELFEKKKAQLAELGMALLEDPESNIRSLNDLLILCNDMDQKIVQLGIMSLLAVFRDIIPRYMTVHFSYHHSDNVSKGLILYVS
jgi:nucleolar complex protein 3